MSGKAAKEHVRNCSFIHANPTCFSFGEVSALRLAVCQHNMVVSAW